MSVLDVAVVKPGMYFAPVGPFKNSVYYKHTDGITYRILLTLDGIFLEPLEEGESFSPVNVLDVSDSFEGMPSPRILGEPFPDTEEESSGGWYKAY